MVINPSNGLSLLRGPLAFCFLIENSFVRLVVVVLAMLSDIIDGYLARRYRYTSKLGAALDPIMDKFFVYFVLAVLFFGGKIELWAAATMIARDFFLFIFGLYLLITKRWKTFQFHSVRWGKVTTGAQFIVIISLIFLPSIPYGLYFLFIFFGLFTFLELLIQELRSPA